MVAKTDVSTFTGWIESGESQNDRTIEWVCLEGTTVA